MNKLIACIFLILFGSCGDDNFKKYSSLKGFRVLGLIANLPEVSDTNDTISITPILSDIENEGRSIKIKVEGCVDPGIANGEEIDCFGGQKYQLFSENLYDLSALLGGSYFTGAITPINVTIPSGVLNGRSIFEQYNGIDYILVFTFFYEDKRILKSFKRIKVSSRLEKNSNPTIDSVDAILMTSSDQQLSINVSESPESFTFYDLTGKVATSSEVYYVSWFSSSGEIETSQVYLGEKTKINLGDSLPDELVLVVILRDGRGGVTYQLQNLP